MLLRLSPLVPELFQLSTEFTSRDKVGSLRRVCESCEMS